MDKRWAVGLSLGSATFVAKEVASPKVTFGVAELAVRYRFRPALEVDLALIGGGAMKGELSLAGIYFDFRYRFIAEQPWNAVRPAALGAAVVVDSPEGTAGAVQQVLGTPSYRGAAAGVADAFAQMHAPEAVVSVLVDAVRFGSPVQLRPTAA